MIPAHYDVCIIGAGLSGLSVAAFLLQQRPTLKILLLEGSVRTGGAIRTFRQNGYLAEWGPHGFLDNCDESKMLIRLAGLEAEAVKAPLGTYVRHICLGGRLQTIPQSPLKLLRAPLIPALAKVGVLADLWRKPLAGEPSVAEWTAHRFGTALLPFADAVFTGTYAGDIARLRIDAVMAGVRDLEKRHGSVIRGVFAKMRASRGKGRGKKDLPAMTSFQGGMTRLPEALAGHLAQAGVTLHRERPVQSVHRLAHGWQVRAAGISFDCRHLVSALPVNLSLPLLSAALPAPPPLPAIPEARIATVVLGFDHRADIPSGFGYLAPESEGRFTLGALFSSNMFPGRAPEGFQLMEALVGGRRHPERLELDDDRLIGAVCQDLRQLMSLPPSPGFSVVLRTESGIPQLEEGFTELLAWRRRLEESEPCLHVCGFGWKGIGINDMTKEAWRIARRIGAEHPIAEGSDVKGIYF